MAADDIGGRAVALNQTCRFGLGVMFVPVLGIDAIVGLDNPFGPNTGSMEL